MTFHEGGAHGGAAVGGQQGAAGENPPARPQPQPAGPNFAKITWDLAPEEPQYLFGPDGKVQQNRADFTMALSKQEFRGHLDNMFNNYYDMLKNRPKCQCSKNEKVSMSTLDNALLGNLDAMLTAITEDIYNTQDFQRGVADYQRAYVRAWNMFTDEVRKIQFTGVDGRRIDRNDVLFKYSNALATGNPPGIYRNGQLYRMSYGIAGIPKRPTSEYAANKLRRDFLGAGADLRQYSFVDKLVQQTEGGWRDAVTASVNRAHPEWEQTQVEEEVQRRLDAILMKKYDLSEATLEAWRKEKTAGPNIQHQLPTSADIAYAAAHEGLELLPDLPSLDQTVDFRYRNVTAKTLVTDLKLGIDPRTGKPRIIRDAKDLEKYMDLRTIRQGDEKEGYEQYLEYNTTKGYRKVRGRVAGVPGEGPSRGLVFLGRLREDPDQSTVLIMDYTKGDKMIDDLGLRTPDPYAARLFGVMGIGNPELSRIQLAAQVKKGDESKRAARYLPLVDKANDDVGVRAASESEEQKNEREEKERGKGYHLSIVEIYTLKYQPYEKVIHTLKNLDITNGIGFEALVQMFETWPKEGELNDIQKTVLKAMKDNVTDDNKNQWRNAVRAYCGRNAEGATRLISELGVAAAA